MLTPGVQGMVRRGKATIEGCAKLWEASVKLARQIRWESWGVEKPTRRRLTVGLGEIILREWYYMINCTKLYSLSYIMLPLFLLPPLQSLNWCDLNWITSSRWVTYRRTPFYCTSLYYTLQALCFLQMEGKSLHQQKDYNFLYYNTHNIKCRFCQSVSQSGMKPEILHF